MMLRAAMTALGLMATTALTACSIQVGRPSYSYATAPCPDPNIPELGPGVNLGPNFTCGYLTVPENRDKPDGRTIRVAVTRAKAASATTEAGPDRLPDARTGRNRVPGRGSRGGQRHERQTAR